MLLAAFAVTIIIVTADELYAPPGMYLWDPWFVRDGDTCHAFYLEAPRCLPKPELMHGHQHIGHATSTDLVHWTNHGPAVVPVHGTWNDHSIATGCVFRANDGWLMPFTGRGNPSGIGIAQSEDLMAWQKVGDAPFVLLGKAFGDTHAGADVRWIGLADPYVYPEPVDGVYWMALNARVEGAEQGVSGCIALMRSENGLDWEPAGIAAWPRWFERMETPQIWHRDGRWYLLFGSHGGLQSDAFRAVAPEPATRCGNFVFQADRIEGPYRPLGQWWMSLPDGRPAYIYKIVTAPDGSDVLLTAAEQKLSLHYPVSYGEDGSITLKPA